MENIDREREAALVEQARAALRRDDAAAASAYLHEMIDPPLLMVAQACNRLNDADGEQKALMAILAREPRNMAALMAMGENAARRNDPRAATSWFRTALAQASVTGVSEAARPMLDRAQTFIRQAGANFEAHLQAAVGDDIRLPRLAHAMDLLLGKVPLYLQQPNMFYFPGLPQRAFYEREEFDWVADIEAKTPLLRAELEAVLADGRDFAPYVETPTDRPAPNNPLRDDPSWGAYYFWQGGAPVGDHAARCPEIMAALALAPMPIIPARSPIALWSLLKPGTHIAPHHGMLNTRLICHLPLIAPPDCALRVGHETRVWEEGKMLIFDDSIEHEAWNRGLTTRVVLLFEIWRPEVAIHEREALTRLFEAIDLHGGGAAESGGPA
jgi:aspartyl/asparaginyl beta-hydroxylase (cupin superfamily)